MLAALAAIGAFHSAEARTQTMPSAVPGWRFAVSPYAWVPSVSGDLRYTLPGTSGGAFGAGVRVDAVNVLEALDFAAMLAAEARNGRFSISTDFIYLDLGNSKSQVRSIDFVQVGRNPISSSLDAGTEASLRGSLWTLGGGYTLAQGGWGHVDGFAGFRLFSVRARTDVRLAAEVTGPGPGLSFAKTAPLGRDEDLIDGIADLRGRFVLGRGFHLPYAFDIGGGSPRLTWQASAGLGYQTGWAGGSLGWRHLSYDQGGSKLLRDFSFGGPYLALNLTF